MCETRVFDELLFKLLLKQFEMTEKNPEILAEKYFSLINIMQDAECDSLDIEVGLLFEKYFSIIESLIHTIRPDRARVVV